MKIQPGTYSKEYVLIQVAILSLLAYDLVFKDVEPGKAGGTGDEDFEDYDDEDDYGGEDAMDGVDGLGGGFDDDNDGLDGDQSEELALTKRLGSVVEYDNKPILE